MKLSTALILLPAAASAVHLRVNPRMSLKTGHPPQSEYSSADTLPAPVPSDGPRLAVLYGEPKPQKDNRTEAVAKMIAAEAGVDATFFEKPYDNYDFSGYEAIMVGAPTYNTGEMNYRSMTDWDDWLYDELPNIDIRGKRVAVFGSGKPWYQSTHDDGSIYWKGYGDNFGDAMGELYDRFAEAGATMYGFTDGSNTDPVAGGFNYTRSKFVRNGQFMGQMFDQKSQEELSPGRAKDWVQQLRDEGFFPDEAPAPALNVAVLYGEPTPRHHAGEADSNRTEAVARLIAAEVGVEATFFETPFDNYDFAGYDAIIAGSPTYNTGDTFERSNTAWDVWLYNELPNLDLRGKKVAIFGSGKPWYSGTHDDGSIYWKGYGDNFGDAMGELYDRFAEAGAEMFGFTDGMNTDPAAGGFNYTRSKFVRNGKFMGQMFDQKSQEELSPGRAKDWVQQLREEGFFS